MTFATLRALHTIIGDAIDDIERVYSVYPDPISASHSPPCSSGPYASPPLTPSTAYPRDPTSPSAHLDFPSLDEPCDPASAGEALTSDPSVVDAISRIVAASGQLAATIQSPFLTLCDAAMAYHLPSCLRLLEAAHIVEILREGSPDGVHVDSLSEKTGVERSKLAHILRLLCTHHIMRELSPNRFTVNRISSLIDSGKTSIQLREFEKSGTPQDKYRDTDGIAAFIGLCTDELQKSAAYLTEAYLLSPSPPTRLARDPTRAPFCFAFGCVDEGNRKSVVPGKKGVGYFAWLEGECHVLPAHGVEIGVGDRFPPAPSLVETKVLRNASISRGATQPSTNSNHFRLERFGYAMNGTCSWDAPGSVLTIFPWHNLPRGSIIVDVGGGIGSTTMVLATALLSEPTTVGTPENSALKFIIQDREPVCQMGEKAWRDQCPSFLETGSVTFQVHDFFEQQPIKNATVFYLRVILHDWPDSFARRILINLREAALDNTTLIISDFVLPLACVDDLDSSDQAQELQQIKGAERRLGQPPLLANMGKASSVAYWMDLTMQVTFNAQERTLREIAKLVASAGWKVKKVARVAGSLFGHIIAIPATMPWMASREQTLEPTNSSWLAKRAQATAREEAILLSSGIGFNSIRNCTYSRSGTPTFGSRTNLPRPVALRPSELKGSSGTKVPIPTVKMGNPIPLRKRPSSLAISARARAQTPSTSKKINTPICSPPAINVPTSPLVRIRRLSNASKVSPIRGGDSRIPVAPSTPIKTVGTDQSTGMSCPRVQPTLRRRASHATLLPSPTRITSPIPPIPPLPTSLGSPLSIKATKITTAATIQGKDPKYSNSLRRASSTTLSVAHKQEPNTTGEGASRALPKNTKLVGAGAGKDSPSGSWMPLLRHKQTSSTSSSNVGHVGIEPTEYQSSPKALEPPAQIERGRKKWWTVTP